MLTFLLSVVIYAVIGWVFVTVGSVLSDDYQHMKGDELFMAALFWPIVLVIVLCYWMHKGILKFAYWLKGKANP